MPTLTGGYNLAVEVIASRLGLVHVLDTVVGDDLLRGVSGGQRRRVTLGEMLMGHPRVIVGDELSTGLDASTTHSIVQQLASWSVTASATTIISLLQPAPEVCALFDDVMLQARGEIYYYGPSSRVFQHFTALQYARPVYKDPADFLLDLSSRNGQKYLADSATCQHKSLAELVTAYRDSEIYKHQLRDLNKPCQGSGGNLLLQSPPYALAWGQAFQAALKREVLLTKLAPANYFSRFIECLMTGLTMGTVFFQLSSNDTSTQGSRLGCFMFATISCGTGQMSNIVAIVSKKQVFFKQRNAGFMPPSAFCLVQTVMQLPISFVAEAGILWAEVYFLTGCAVSSHGLHFCVAWALLGLFSLAFSEVVRAFSYLAPKAPVASLMGGIFILCNMVTSGFMITADKIPPFWIWLYWGLPSAWTMRALAINEYSATIYDEMVTIDGSGATQRQGDYFLEMYQFRTEEYWIWATFAVLLAWLCAALGVSRWALTVCEAVESFASSGNEDEAPLTKAEEVMVELPAESSQGASSPLDIPPVTISFLEIDYFVTIGKKANNQEMQLLSKVSGFFCPGTMTALMGSSGAGKTTLMDVLASRKTGGRIEGIMKINGFHKDEATFPRMIGYVEQTSIHNGRSTLHEALMFSAQLRTDPGIPDKAKAQRVRVILEMLEMTSLADAVVATMSAEQLKRLTMGVELAADPSVLFLDEPTSGLDSRAANVCTSVMTRIARSGRTIVCTIHQPSSEIFFHFDSLLLLRKGGETVFFGKLGAECSALTQYLRNLPGGVDHLSEGMNPAVWMLDVISTYHARDIAVEYTSSELCAENLASAVKHMDTKLIEMDFASPFATSLSHQMYHMIVRAMVDYWRSPDYNLTRLVFCLGSGLAFGSLWKGAGENCETVSDVLTAMGGLFMSIFFPGIVFLVLVVPVFVHDRAVFYREKASHTYIPYAFSMSMFVAELPYILLSDAFFSLAFYPLFAGSSLTLQKFLSFYLMWGLFILTIVIYGQTVAVFKPTAQVASKSGMFAFIMWGLFGGFFHPGPELLDVFLIFHYVNPTRWTLNGLVSMHFASSGDRITDPANPYGAETSADSYIDERYGFNYESFWPGVYVMLCLLLSFLVASAFGLTRVNHLSR
ncbi:hypothetical protein CYMTET_5016 [Cymbomonas tetramitiformis]|uniref:ABC transporter domain-containing protein n=1 Tax=Cymbomonas tetramitiformis TaxID=36881 RepID=A0AAE0H093_9CHLO|nr:hypothetical protein CYMTET_5016 [Cymbomonas tetramitiformis]